ncbi:CDP-diacylglycerol--serine O-phosphatidyltransferase [Anaplasmataceae bacterium AB001_6]|nr:CDP-diacylglycerol--serine O-phosphatidyltransferase [Anaplasmataceae bacterium AB001_6]
MQNNRNNRLIPVYKLFPNIVTIVSILLGLTAIKAMLSERWEFASILIFLATIFDALDGRIARILSVETSFGAHLDSLADFCNFGIVPALLMYLWKLNEIKIFGWTVTMLYVVSIVIRLARFNVSISANDTKIKEMNKNFFFGIPSPAAAILFIMPLLMSNDPCWLFISSWFYSKLGLIFYAILIACLSISKFATFSTKNMQIPENMIAIVQCFIGAYCILIFVRPWMFIPVSAILFLFSIPISHYIFLSRNSRKDSDL